MFVIKFNIIDDQKLKSKVEQSIMQEEGQISDGKKEFEQNDVEQTPSHKDPSCAPETEEENKDNTVKEEAKDKEVVRIMDDKRRDAETSQNATLSLSLESKNIEGVQKQPKDNAGQDEEKGYYEKMKHESSETNSALEKDRVNPMERTSEKSPSRDRKEQSNIVN